MTHDTLFSLVFGATALASVLALVGDMIGQRSAGRIATAALLAVAGAVSVAGGWALKPAVVFDSFIAGMGFSSAPGVVLLLAGIALFATADDHGSTPALVALAAGGAALAACSTDLVALLVALEISAMSGYALVSSARTRRADEASIKYFVQGAVATGLFVLGIAVLVGGVVGSGRLADIVPAIRGMGQGATSPVLLGVMAVVTALAFKTGAAPFHSWAPDAYENAPAPVAGFMSGAVKLGALSALAVFGVAMARAGAEQDSLFGLIGTDLFAVLGTLAVASVVVGSTVALNTSSYTRMLGYAGVAQVGYGLVAIAASDPTSALIFGATYAVATTGAFVAAAAVLRLRPGWDGSIEGLSGVARRAPWLSAAITILLISLAGIPPLLGFWGKLSVFGVAIRKALSFGAQPSMMPLALWLGTVVAIALAGSIVSLGYYGSVIRAMYFGDAEEDVAEKDAAEKDAAVKEVAGGEGETDGAGETRGPAPSAVVIGLALVVIALGLVPLAVGLPTAVSGFLLG